MSKKSWLTDKQKKILELREEGYSQSEIAEKLDTTRSNISVIEKNAKQNIKKSEKTLEIAELIKSPKKFEIDEEVDIHDIPRIIYRKADDENIKINLPGPELLKKVREKADQAFEDKKLIGEIEIGISKKGNVRIQGVKPKNE